MEQSAQLREKGITKSPGTYGPRRRTGEVGRRRGVQRGMGIPNAGASIKCITGGKPFKVVTLLLALFYRPHRLPLAKMSFVVRTFSKWYFGKLTDRLSRLGLTYHDAIAETGVHDLAVSRLPEQMQAERARRLKRAQDLSAKHVEVPLEQRVRPCYCGGYVESWTIPEPEPWGAWGAKPEVWRLSGAT